MVISNRAVTCSVPALLLPLLFYVRSHQKSIGSVRSQQPVFMQSAHTVFAVSWEPFFLRATSAVWQHCQLCHRGVKIACFVCCLFCWHEMLRDGSTVQPLYWLLAFHLACAITFSQCQCRCHCSALLLASQCHAAAFFIMLWLFYALRFLRQWQLT